MVLMLKYLGAHQTLSYGRFEFRIFTPGSSAISRFPLSKAGKSLGNNGLIVSVCINGTRIEQMIKVF